MSVLVDSNIYHYNWSEGISDYVSSQAGASKVFSVANKVARWVQVFSPNERAENIVSITGRIESYFHLPKFIKNLSKTTNSFAKGDSLECAEASYNLSESSYNLYKLGQELKFYKVIEWTKFLGVGFSVGLFFSKSWSFSGYLKEISAYNQEMESLLSRGDKGIKLINLKHKKNLSCLCLVESILSITAVMFSIISFFFINPIIPVVMSLSLSTLSLSVSVTKHFYEEKYTKNIIEDQG